MIDGYLPPEEIGRMKDDQMAHEQEIFLRQIKELEDRLQLVTLQRNILARLAREAMDCQNVGDVANNSTLWMYIDAHETTLKVTLNAIQMERES